MLNIHSLSGTMQFDENSSTECKDFSFPYLCVILNCVS